MRGICSSCQRGPHDIATRGHSSRCRLDKTVNRQRRWIRAQRKLDRCGAGCGKKSYGEYYCKEHREERNAYRRNRRLRHLQELLRSFAPRAKGGRPGATQKASLGKSSRKSASPPRAPSKG